MPAVKLCVDCSKVKEHYAHGKCRPCYSKWYASQPGQREKLTAIMQRCREKKPEVYQAIEDRRNKTEKRKKWKEKYQKEYYQRNAEKLRASACQWRKDNPEHFKELWQAAYARRKSADGHITKKQWRELVEFYCPDGKCLACGQHFCKDITNRWLTMDHVTPLSIGGTHWPENIQPLCYSCNCSKSDHSNADYRPDGGAFTRRLMQK